MPVIQQVRSFVGCEYIYLFAADAKKNGHLVDYYKSLGFEIREDLSVSKPEYDFCKGLSSCSKRVGDAVLPDQPAV